MQALCGISVLLTNDTGTMHLADFLGVPSSRSSAPPSRPSPVLARTREHRAPLIRSNAARASSAIARWISAACVRSKPMMWFVHFFDSCPREREDGKSPAGSQEG